ncbi:MAG: cytochrome P450 [Burkholderiaceae bacterium]|nr:cytochrome P450 [Burkholderiaceae bacterium]
MKLLFTPEAADGPVTPASALFDPFDPDYVKSPYARLALLRESEPLFYSPELGYWIVTRFETVRNVMRDTKRFSSTITGDPLRPLCPAARAIIQNSNFNVPPLLVNNDAPGHTRLRRFFGAPLQPANFAALEPYARATAERYIDRMLALPRPLDLVRHYTWDIPALVLIKFIGIPEQDLERVKAWSDSRVALTSGLPSDEEQMRLSRGAVEYYQYASDLVQSKFENPGQDYLSDLIRLRAGDDANASLHEITVHLFNLLFAGHETTASAAANMFLALLEHPDKWEAVCRGDTPLAQVVEEALRYEPPIQARRRLAVEDVEIEGRTLPAGARLMLMVASANHDPERFADPESFCPGRREASQHLTFGIGAHFCMGAPLARQELTVMLEALVRRIPGLRLAPDHKADYVPNTSFRGTRNVLVTW